MDNNQDVFHKEIPEGINTIAVGLCSPFDEPLVIVGGNRRETCMKKKKPAKIHSAATYFYSKINRIYPRLRPRGRGETMDCDRWHCELDGIIRRQ